ncbi:hypothetical protein OEZ60_12315 [Defluviimonas sp. WL0024]|uniref:Uncharacterized protein n=2 Tax=Albidovulum TaxID=205889 RepID=A0ABT3J395_9RHOB|nr:MULTISPECIES: hypothetical protein [Defluviimonas]MCU9848788.1 hypothetical protein [Defluviimonas sp. WL0024]MCW3782146.1 hypothetical protein [Defluviimonas salinarum]
MFEHDHRHLVTDHHSGRVQERHAIARKEHIERRTVQLHAEAAYRRRVALARLIAPLAVLFRAVRGLPITPADRHG